MSNEMAEIGAEIRERILKSPDVILDDPEMMQALAAANTAAMGDNIVDLRGIAMQRLEERLDRLEDAHRHVVAAAHDNLAGMHLIHRAALRLLEADTLDTFLRDLAGPVAEILRVECATLLIEGASPPEAGEVLQPVAAGHLGNLLTGGRQVSPRHVTLRQTGAGSEALLLLDLGHDGPAGLLCLSARDPEQFAPNQGTDLLAFFASVAERALRRWL